MTTVILALAILAQAAAKPDETAANAALEKFKIEYKAKETPVRVTAVVDLARVQGDKIVVRLAQVLTSPDDKEVRIAAAKGLGGATENKKKPMQALAAAVGPSQQDPAVVAAILEALGKLGDQGAVAVVENNFKSKNTLVLKAAVEAAGELKGKSSVPQLIDLCKRLEEGAKEAPSVGGGGNYGGGNLPGVGGGGVVDDMARERERVVKPIVIKVLGALTKTNLGMAKEWENWWRTEGGKFMSGK